MILRTSIQSAELLKRLLDFRIVFVVGLFKTGTSIAAKICSEIGFFDPSRITNPNERGYGVTVPRYLTHECSIVRRINELLLGGEKGSKMPRAYLEQWGVPLVVKDPQFVFTLPAWLEAAEGTSVVVMFTSRSIIDLRRAWDHAPYTRQLLQRGMLVRYRTAFAKQVEQCRRSRLAHFVVPIETLKAIHFRFACEKGCHV